MISKIKTPTTKPVLIILCVWSAATRYKTIWLGGFAALLTQLEVSVHSVIQIFGPNEATEEARLKTVEVAQRLLSFSLTM